MGFLENGILSVYRLHNAMVLATRSSASAFTSSTGIYAYLFGRCANDSEQ